MSKKTTTNCNRKCYNVLLTQSIAAPAEFFMSRTYSYIISLTNFFVAARRRRSTGRVKKVVGDRSCRGGARWRTGRAREACITTRRGWSGSSGAALGGRRAGRTRGASWGEFDDECWLGGLLLSERFTKVAHLQCVMW